MNTTPAFETNQNDLKLLGFILTFKIHSYLTERTLYCSDQIDTNEKTVQHLVPELYNNCQSYFISIHYLKFNQVK